MIKFSRNPLRWVMAIILAPIAPLLVLLVANTGKNAGTYAGILMMPVLQEHPWVLVLMGLVINACLLYCLLLPFFAPRLTTPYKK